MRQLPFVAAGRECGNVLRVAGTGQDTFAFQSPWDSQSAETGTAFMPSPKGTVCLPV